MKNKWLLFFVLLFLVISANAQLPRIFNSNIVIGTYTDLGAGKIQIIGQLNSADLIAEDLLPGDLLFDQVKREYKILNITPGGSNGGSSFDVVTQYLGGGGGAPEPLTGAGIICRTTSNGFPVIADDLLPDAIQNASMLAVDAVLSKYKSGATLPVVSGAVVGDYVFYSADNAVYNLTSNGWIKISPIQDAYMSNPSTETYFPANGTVVNNLIDPLGYYVSTGTAWVAIPTVSYMPTVPPKFGDVYQVIGDKIYMFGASGAWEPISGASAVTPGTVFPTSPKIGDFFYNTTTNILYVYDATSAWKEVSVNGSTPNNSPAPIATKEGELYFDSSDKKLYVNNGIQWMPVDNSLPNGKVYIGNAAGEATPKDLTGDVTVLNSGVTAIGNLKVTNAMLNKSAIPLSGFAVPTANIAMGGFKLTGLGNPAVSPGGDQDAATKFYVDTHTINLNTIPLFTGHLLKGVAGVASDVAQNTIPVSGFGAATASVDLGTNKIVNLADPTVATDAASKKYVDATSGVVYIGIAAPLTPQFGTIYYNLTDKRLYIYQGGTWQAADNSLPTGMLYVGDTNGYASPTLKSNILLSGFGAAAADVSLGGFKITNLADPITGAAGLQNAATRKYVDDKVATVTTPSGTVFPSTPTESNTFYNTTTHLYYVYNGTDWIPLGNDLLNTQMYVGDINNKAVSTPKANIPVSGFAAATADVTMGGFKITNLADPVAGAAGLQNATTRKYVDNLVATVATTTGAGYPPTTPVPAAGTTYYDTLNKIYYVSNGTDWSPLGNDLANNEVYVGDATNKAVATLKTSVPLSDWGTATSNISMGGTNNITNLADPRLTVAGLQDAATRKYVDGKAGSVTTSATTPAVGILGSTYYNTTDKTYYISDGLQWLPVNNILPTGQLYVGDATNKAIATPTSSVPLSGFGAPIANLSAGSFKITNLADPVLSQDAASKNYVDNSLSTMVSSIPLAKGSLLVGDASGKAAPIAKSAMTLSGFADADANISMGTGSNNYKIINVANPTGDQDAATKYYVDNKVIVPTAITLTTNYLLVGNASNQATAVPKSNVSLSEFGAITGNLSLATYQITNLGDPVLLQDAVTKKYVDNALAAFTSTPALTLGELFVGNASNKAVSTPKNSIPLSGFAAAATDIDLGTHKLVNVTDPTASQDAATKNYVDTRVIDPTTITLATGKLFVGNASGKATETLKTAIPISGFGAAAADIDLGTHKILNVTDPTGNQDAATKNYVDTRVIDPSTITLATGKLFVGNASGKATETLKTAISLSGFGAPTADVDFGAKKITNLVDPAADQDASTKKYVDTQVAGVKLAQIATNTMLGNNTALTADPLALTPLQVKTMLSLNNVDNTSDATKNVLSASKLTTAIKINGVDFDGSTNVTIPGDNMGNHTATQNIKTVTFAINSDGVNGKGLTFDTPGNATFGQDVTVNGNFYTPSDQRLKKNIETLGNALQSIDSMRGVRFEYKDQKKYAKGPKIGVIAQELMKVFPEMVTKGTDGFYKVDYTQLSAILIQAVKEQQKMIQQQHMEINELKSRLDQQQLQIDAILKKIK